MTENNQSVSKLIKFSPTLFSKIKDYQREKDITFFSHAVFELIREGLDYSKSSEVKMTPDLLLTIESLFTQYQPQIQELHEYEARIKREVESLNQNSPAE